jgi:hypothetical protein
MYWVVNLMLLMLLFSNPERNANASSLLDGIFLNILPESSGYQCQDGIKHQKKHFIS